MKYISRIHYCLAVVAALILFVTQFAHAAEAGRLSGSYQIVHKVTAGPRTHVQLQIKLINHSSGDLRIQRLTLWDSSHASGSQKCSLLLHAGASTETTQEFTLSHADYEFWQRGSRPRLVLELQAPHGRATTEVVRLDHTSRGRAN